MYDENAVMNQYERTGAQTSMGKRVTIFKNPKANGAFGGRLSMSEFNPDDKNLS